MIQNQEDVGCFQHLTVEKCAKVITFVSLNWRLVLYGVSCWIHGLVGFIGRERERERDGSEAHSKPQLPAAYPDS